MQDRSKKFKIYRIKIALVGFMFFFFCCAIILRSYQLQILDNSKLKQLAKSQYNTKLIVSPRRGAIYDRNGEVLALDILVASVGIHPNQVRGDKGIKELLLKFTEITKKDLEKKLASKRSFEWIQRRIPLELGKMIEKKRRKGIQVVREYRRFYPNKELAGQLMGAVGYDAQALGGLELSYDKYLKKSTTQKNVERDARGKFFSSQSENDINHDIYLTIDKNIQFIAEEALQEFAIKHKVKNGFAIVMDVETSEILALANYPSFNPNLYWKYPQKIWKNRAISTIYEPGSTFKAVLMAAALEAKKIKPDDRFFCENGKYKIYKDEIRDHAAYGWLDAKSIFKVSSNIGMTKIAQKLGRKKFYEFIKRIGFGKSPGLGIIGESSGNIKPYKTWKEIELSNIAFGQGIGVNGMQMVVAYSAIANRGDLVKPTIVKRIVNSRGKLVFEPKNQNRKKLLSESTIKALDNMLYSVTQVGGTASEAHIKGYLAAGKTGTAQKYDHKLKTYAKHDYVSSFIGYSPLAQPKVLVYVVYDSPRQNGYYGGIVAGPAFKKIAGESLKYLGVIPGLELKKNETDLSSQELALIRDKRLKDIQLSLKKKTVPDLRGLSLRKVFQLTQDKGIKLDIKGSGVVVNQIPKPGTKFNAMKKWQIELESRS